MPLCVILNEYQSGQSVTLVHNTHTAAKIGAQELTYKPNFQAIDGQQVNRNNQDLVGQQELPLDDNPWTEELTSAVVARPSASDGKRRLSRAARIRGKLAKALVVGILSLIVLPGIILGVLMKETMAGIALSSAIIALINLFAGLYYYINKRD